MASGTVKFFNSAKKFGFITPNDGSNDVFVHENGLVDSIKDGDTVEYQTEPGKKGPSAIDVKVIR